MNQATFRRLGRPKRSREQTGREATQPHNPRTSCFTQGGMTAELSETKAEPGAG